MVAMFYATPLHYSYHLLDSRFPLSLHTHQIMNVDACIHSFVASRKIFYLRAYIFIELYLIIIYLIYFLFIHYECNQTKQE